MRIKKMPVKIGNKTYKGHNRAAAAVKKKDPSITNPHAYVAAIENRQRKGKGKKK